MKTTLLTFLIAISAMAQFAPAGGNLTGTVLDPKGKAVPGSFITLVSELAPGQQPKDFKPGARSTTVDPQGNFLFTGLDPGRYRLCAEAGHLGFASNCWWGEGPLVDVGANAIVTGIAVRIEAGLEVRVRIEDPAKLRDTAKSKNQALGLWAEVKGNKTVPMPLRIEKDDKDGIVYVGIAPIDRELRLRVKSGGAKFNDSDKVGANPEKQEDEYIVPAGDLKSREIKVKLQSLVEVAK